MQVVVVGYRSILTNHITNDHQPLKPFVFRTEQLPDCLPANNKTATYSLPPCSEYLRESMIVLHRHHHHHQYHPSIHMHIYACKQPYTIKLRVAALSRSYDAAKRKPCADHTKQENAFCTDEFALNRSTLLNASLMPCRVAEVVSHFFWRSLRCRRKQCN